MQERYLGDVHDFYKFLFLKYLSKKLKEKIGLNWYLVSPKQVSLSEDKKKDGEKRNYLKNKEICSLDSSISEEFINFIQIEKRNIIDFTERTHLKRYIKFYNKKITVLQRKSWFQESLFFFKNQEVIFLDPDNGILKNKNKNSLKHILIDEINRYLIEKKIVIFTQFQSYNTNHLIYLREIKDFFLSNNVEILMPILRNRTAPNTFFVTAGNKKALVNKKLFQLYKMYGEKFKDKVELITV